MKCYKGFDKDLKCRGFQYAIGKAYEEDTADICCKGFHACENPMDVFGYYNPADSRYCEVDLDANEQTEEDSKRVGKKIKIETEIGLSGLIQAGVKFILEKVNSEETKETNTGARSAATNTGDCSAATNTGDCSAATNTGARSAATNTGARSAATNTGDCSAATNTGDCSAATNTGNYSAATNTGNYSAATVEGADSIAIVTGYSGKAKGAVGCWLVLTERDEKMHILGVQTVRVDGETIKTDTFYMLKNGEITEADE